MIKKINNLKKVMVFGAFDILHQGHEYFLKKSKEKGEYLIVIVGRDLTIKKVKGNLPYKKEKDRLKNILNLKFVDKAELGNKDDIFKPIKKHNPNIICLGYDQKHFIDIMKEKINELKIKPKIYRIKPFKKETYKSSIIKKKIYNKNNKPSSILRNK